MLENLAYNLPHLNATLNILATLLLIYGRVLAKRGNFAAHRRIMIACFGVSILFLTAYLLHKYSLWATTGAANRPFPKDPDVASLTVRYCYYALLLSHLTLAITVPFLAILAIVLGLRDQRIAHRRLVRWAWPIWLYVSVTGVLVYVMLYHLYCV